MDFNIALEHVIDGDAILFCGAGFSLGAINLRGTSLKSGHALAAHLAKLIGTPLDSLLPDLLLSCIQHLRPHGVK